MKKVEQKIDYKDSSLQAASELIMYLGGARDGNKERR